MGLKLNQAWRGPHPTLDAAVDHAIRYGTNQQVPTVAIKDNEDGLFRCWKRSEVPDAKYAFAYTPDPKHAPTWTWPIVKLEASTDRDVIEIAASNWRRLAKLNAKTVNAPGTLKPYKVDVKHKTIRLYGRGVTLYTVIVRQNPKFPHDKLAALLPQ